MKKIKYIDARAYRQRHRQNKSSCKGWKKSKSVQHKIDEFKKGNIDYQTVDKYIKDYKYGQRDASELVLDTLTGLSAFGMYSAARKITTFISPFASKDIASKAGKYSKGIGIGLGVLTGIFTKPTLRFIDRIYLKRKEKKIIKLSGKMFYPEV